MTQPLATPGSAREAAPAAAAAAVSPGYARYVLGVLFVVYVFNFIDRQVLAILLEPIQQDLGVSDTAMGFLSGFAFALLYTLAGIPVARWADRSSRRTIIAVGLLLWSAMTIASGLARSFLQLALARVGVGIGEAAGTPPAHSLISDYFPPERRGAALGFYAMGIYVGSMIAMLGGGWLERWFDWRTAFFVAGAPGLLLALIVRFTVRELPRGLSEAGRADVATESVSDVIRFLRTRRTFLWILAAASCQSLSGYGVLIWGPTFFSRVHGMERVDIGLWLGLIVGVGGGIGALLGGAVADRIGRRDPRAYAFVPAFVSLAGVPFALGFLFFGDPKASLLSFLPFYLLGAAHVGPMLSMVQGLVRLRMRATASAIHLFVLNLIGMGAGPFVVGWMNDLLVDRVGPEAVRYSLLLGTAFGGVSGLLFLQASRTLREELVSEIGH